MKSYFAKLADRATIGTPATPIALSATQSRNVKDSISDELEQRQPHPKSTTHTHSADFVAETPAAIEHVLTPTRVVEQFEAPFANRTTQASEKPPREVESSEPATDVLQPRAGVESSASSFRAHFDGPDESPDDSSLSLNINRLVAVQQDQVRLLKRADEFMGDLLTRRSHSEESREAQHDRAQESTNTARLQPTTPPVSTVARPTARTPEQTESPSLVIGKLTVEVSSPTPQPPESSRVIVVHKGDNKRSIAPSSRRFGLSQF